MAEDVQKIERLKPNPFISGPGDLLAFYVAEQLRNRDIWKKIFGTFIDDYERSDYSFRNLPALRVYTPRFQKLHESHYIVGDLVLDVVWPPSIRRTETQRLPDIVCSALAQQFRSPTFFSALRAVVPGLNECGKEFNGDKTLALMLSEGEAPLTHIVANFRLDLKEWDAYLESQGRTKDDPFEVTLKDLKTIVTEIQGLREGSDEVQVTVPLDQTPGLGGV